MKSHLLISFLFVGLSTVQALDEPQVSIHRSTFQGQSGFSLEWDAVAGANRYSVLLRDTLFQQESLLFTTAKTAHWLPERDGTGVLVSRRFFRVVADSVALPHEPAMTLVPAGTFTMGDDVAGYPEHTVTLSKAFHLGTLEVSNRQYMEQLQWAYDNGLVSVENTQVKAYDLNLLDLEEDGEIRFNDGLFYLEPTTSALGASAYPDGYDPGEHPVKDVTFFGAACYCDWLSMRNGLPPYYNGDWSQRPDHNPYESAGYRLPTDAEWEYSARSNDLRNYPWGEAAPTCSLANHDGSNCEGWTLPVGSLPAGASELGVLDMAGNIREFTGDRYSIESANAVDPLGSQVSGPMTSRGGSFEESVWNLRMMRKGTIGPSVAARHHGFRICRTDGVSTNHAPEKPADPSPMRQEYGVANGAALAWSCADLDEDPLVFDVYLNTDPAQLDAAPIITDLAATSYSPGMLADSTAYYWRVLARDPEGLETPGPVWRFSTSTPPSWLGEMTLVPAGTFMMGKNGVATPEHTVTLQQDYLLGRQEVTHAEFLTALQWGLDNGHVELVDDAAMAWGQDLCRLGTEWSQITFADGHFSVAPDEAANAAYPLGYDPWFLPAAHITWYGAAAYCDFRSMMEGLPPYYNGNWDQNAAHDPYTAAGYRLPTEAEWEYAARYSDGRDYPWGATYPNATLVNAGNFVGWTVLPGSYPAGSSGLGIQDLAGNVSEWTGDRHGDYSAAAVSNPYGPGSGTRRVLRGGGFAGSADLLHTAKRLRALPTWNHATSITGFRLCRTAP